MPVTELFPYPYLSGILARIHNFCPERNRSLFQTLHAFARERKLSFMALIQCPECGNTVSNQATMCPRCGFQLNTYADPVVRYAQGVRKRQAGVACLVPIIFFLGLMACILVFGFVLQHH